ncbi:MAG TPA: CPBP family intramembrane glutamic endopeptidase [Candidatus Acidoferrum sp.]|nr:CPBP family intramembrane glutamic endopeptidase [Candidatus Acidoferrum sp.]
MVECGFAFFFGGGISEEPGWRGFLLPRPQSRFSPLSASLLTWLPWALWHAPLDFAGYAGPTLGAYLQNRVFMLIPVSVILTFIYNRSGGSILSAALFHSASNIAPDFVPFASWAIWLIVGAAVFALFSDKMWRIRNAEPAAAASDPPGQPARP